MGTRIVIGLQPGADSVRLIDELKSIGAQRIQPPNATLPDVIVAEFADDDLQALLRTTGELEGVRYSEPDALRTTYGESGTATGSAADDPV